jgi:hypothetical protein
MIDWDKSVLSPVHGVFDEPVVFIPNIGVQYAGGGIFDEAYREVDLAGGMAVTTESPVLGIRTSQCPVPLLQDDKVLIIGKNITYNIREVRFDGHGSAKLLLNEV